MVNIEEVKERLSANMKAGDAESLVTLLADVQNLHASALETMNKLARTLNEDNEIIQNLSEGLTRFTIRKAQGQTLPAQYVEWMSLAAPNLLHMQLIKAGDERILQQHAAGVDALAEAMETLVRFIRKMEKPQG